MRASSTPTAAHVIVMASVTASVTAHATRSREFELRRAAVDPMRTDPISAAQDDRTLVETSVTGPSTTVVERRLAPPIDQWPATIVATRSRTAPA